MRSFLLPLLSVFLLAYSEAEERFPLLTGERANGLEILIDDIETEFADGEPTAVWGISKKDSKGLYRLGGRKWLPADLSEHLENVFPLDLIRGLEGEVFCLWKSQEKEARCYLTSHQGGEYQLRFDFPDVIDKPVVTPLKGGGVFVSGQSATVLEQRAKEAKPVLRTLPEQAFHSQDRDPGSNSPGDFAPIRVVEIEDGSLLMWSQLVRKSEHRKRLQGILRLGEGANVTRLGIPFEGPSNPISVLTPWMEKRVIVAVAGAGFLDFDPNAEDRKFRSGSAPHFHFVERAFGVHDRWFLISTPRPDETDVKMSNSIKNTLSIETKKFYDPAVETSSLFEAKDGQMIQLTRHLDDEPVFDWFDRPVVAVEGGFWTCVEKGKLAFVSLEDGEDRILKMSKGTGIPLKSPDRIVPQSSDYFVALDTTAKRACLVPSDPGKHQSETKKSGGLSDKRRGSEIMTNSMLAQDEEGRIYGWFDRGKEFRIWEDENWKVLPLSEEFGALGSGVFGVDDRKRFWAFGEGRTDTAFFDPEEREWHVYRLAQDALEKHMAPGSRIRAGDQTGIFPVSSSTEPLQICYVTLGGSIRFFDGGKWAQFPLNSVTNPQGEDSLRDPKLTGAPFFRNGRSLVLPIEYSQWERSQAGTWKESEGELGESTPLFRRTDEQRDLPAVARASIVSSISGHFWDDNGICWICDSKGGVWKAAEEVVLPVFSVDDDNPLERGRTIYEVTSDRFGNAFLRLAFGAGSGLHLQIMRRSELPVGICELVSAKRDSAELKFSGADFFQWRINQEGWSAISATKEVTIDRLPPGVHRFEFRSWNEELVPSLETSEIEFRIEAMSEREFTMMLKNLSSNDVAKRESAVDWLISQGEKVRPQLKSVLKEADQNSAWWIRAVIQEIDRND